MNHQGMLWSRRRDQRSIDSLSLREGLATYATKQSSLQSQLSANFAQRWKEPLGVYSGSIHHNNNNSSSGSDNNDNNDNDDDNGDADDDGNGEGSNSGVGSGNHDADAT